MTVQRRVWSTAVVLLVLLVACGSGEQVGAPVDSGVQTTEPAPPAVTTVTVPESSTVPATTTTTVDPSALLAWERPFRVEGAPLDSPAAGSDAGVVLVRAAAREQGVEAATEVWFSSDALTWERVELVAGVRLRAVATAGRGFVAVGSADTDDLGPASPAGRLPQPVPAVWTSRDGRTWTEASTVDLEPFAYGRMTDVVAGPGGLLAVGEVGDATGSVRPAVWSSPAGDVWTLLPGDPLGTVGDRVWMRAAAGRGGVVAIGQLTPVDRDAPGPVLAWWSPDGVMWEQALDIPSFRDDPLVLGDVAAFGSEFVLVGSRGAQVPLVWLSSDGLNWSDPDPLPTRPGTGSSFVHGLVTDGAILVAAGDDVIFGEGTDPATGDASIWMSGDAIDWAQVPPEQLRGDAALDAAVAFSPLRVGAGWIVLGTTADRAEHERVGIVWFGQ